MYFSSLYYQPWVAFAVNFLCVSTFVPPGSLLPVTVFDGHSLRVLFHFARDSPPSRSDVLVVIISMLSSAPVPVTNISFNTTAPEVGFEAII